MTWSSSSYNLVVLQSHHLRTHWSERNLLEPFVAHAYLSSWCAMKFYKHDLENFRIPSKQQQVESMHTCFEHCSITTSPVLNQRWDDYHNLEPTWNEINCIHCRCLCRWSNYSDFTRSQHQKGSFLEGKSPYFRKIEVGELPWIGPKKNSAWIARDEKSNENGELFGRHRRCS